MKTKEEIITAWSKRHGLDLCSTDLQCAFDDAASTFANRVTLIVLVDRWRMVAKDQDARCNRATMDQERDEAILSLRTASVLRQCAKELEEALK